jgi:hypothetical protein
MAVLTEPAGLPVLSDYPRFVRRHRGPISLLMGVGLLFGAAWSLVQPTTFSATASVVLIPVPMYVTPATVGLVPPEVSIDTDAQLLRSPGVLAAVGDALGTTAGSAEGHLSLTASPESHVLHVTVSATSAQRAARAAQAAVEALVVVRRHALGALRQATLRQLRLFVTNQEDLLAQEQARRLVIPGQDDLFAQILDLRTGLEELEEARREPAQVVRPGVAPTRADHANAEVPITSGAMLGLLAGWLLGAGRDRTRQRDHSTTAIRPEDGRHAD